MLPRSGVTRPTRLLWVEGKDDSAVIQSLCAAHNVPDRFGVQPKNGVYEILNTFFAQLKTRGTERFGVVVDANGSAQGRWDSIRETLSEYGYAQIPERLIPSGMIVPGTPHRPLFGAWVMPDNGSPGALEDFAAMLIPAGDALWARAGEAVDSIPEGDRLFPVGRRSKAHMHTWLAWQESPGSPMGRRSGKATCAPMRRPHKGSSRGCGG